MRILDKINDYLSLDELKGIHEAKVGDREYDEFFQKMLKKYNVKSYKDLPKDKQKEFFNAVDKAWNSKVEKGGDKLKRYKKGNPSWE